MTNPNVQRVIEMLTSLIALANSAINTLDEIDVHDVIRVNLLGANGAIYRGALDLDSKLREQVMAVHNTTHGIMLAQIPASIYITNKVERNRTMSSNYRTIISHAETTIKVLTYNM